MKSKSVYLSSAIAAALVAGGLTTDGSDWPRWGGPDPGRDMISPETGLPDHFASGTNGHVTFKPGAEEPDLHNLPNVKWVAKVGSQSYGNVVVAGGKVFIGTNNENPRDPAAPGRPQHPDVFR